MNNCYRGCNCCFFTVVADGGAIVAAAGVENATCLAVSCRVAVAVAYAGGASVAAVGEAALATGRVSILRQKIIYA